MLPLKNLTQLNENYLLNTENEQQYKPFDPLTKINQFFLYLIKAFVISNFFIFLFTSF